MQQHNKSSQRKPANPGPQKTLGDAIAEELQPGNPELPDRRTKNATPSMVLGRVLLYGTALVGVVLILGFAVASRADEMADVGDVPVMEAAVDVPSEEAPPDADAEEESPGFFARAGKAFHVMTGDEDHDIEYVNTRMAELEELSEHLAITAKDNAARAVALEEYGKMLDARSAKLKEISASLITKAEQIAKDTAIAVDMAWAAP